MKPNIMAYINYDFFLIFMVEHKQYITINISKHSKVQNFIKVWDPMYLLLVLAIRMIYYQFLCILDKFWSNDLDLSNRKVKII